MRGLIPESVMLRPRRPVKVYAAFWGLWHFTRKKPLGAVSAFILVVLIVSAVAAPWMAPYEPTRTALGPSFAAPSLSHPMGLDDIGQDVLSRVIWGGRTSLGIGLTSTALALLLGTIVGLTTGYLGGKLDLFAQRGIDSMIVFPSLILALVLMAVLGQNALNIALAIAFTFAPRMSRVVRSAVLSIKEEPYVEAARAIGCSTARILFRHLLPNVFGSLMVLATLTLGTAIVIEASLSFLGIGSSPAVPSWGRMLSGAATDYLRESPHLAIFPGLAISLTVLSVNFLGDALRDILDPRLRGIT